MAKHTHLDEERFRGILRQNIRPAQPIDSPDLLKGREAKLREISRALSSPGMHVFIHGERGVGKTSTALTAAKAFMGQEAPYVGCDKGANFQGLVFDICRALLDQSSLSQSLSSEVGATLNLKILSFNVAEKGNNRYVFPDRVETVTQAENLISDSASIGRNGTPIVVIDEFDRIQSDELKASFADLIKRIHDMRINVRFLLCGIGRTLDELIGSHLSADRAISPFELEPLPHDARWSILETAAARLGVEIPHDQVVRIGQISDGFPYYIHLIGEYLFWQIFEHIDQNTKATSHDFGIAVKSAIEKAQASLKQAYNYAIQKTKNSTDYEEALWALAESTHLDRQIRSIYDVSYKKIMEQRLDRPHLTIEKFRNRLYNLADTRHGSIVIKKKNSWYSFNENIIRGYVRLVAQKNGLELGAEHF